MIKGVTVTLKKKTKDGKDAFNRDVWKETDVSVKNVLVAPSSSEEVTDALNLYGKRAVYTLGIPKGDTNVWEDVMVVLPAPFAGTYHTIGYPTAGIEGMIPLNWNTKVIVERINE